MPGAADYFASPDNLLRIFIYGYAKSKKTWWAAAAAEAGFNVLLLDIDRGAKIVKQLSDAALKRVHIIPAADRGKQPLAYSFMATFIRTFDCYFHAGRGATKASHMAGATRYAFRDIEPGTVFILDSWSALCRSLIMHYSVEHNIDIYDAKKTEWEGYRWVGTMATWFLESLKALPCHLIIIGHQQTYEKYRGLKQDRKLISVREQPMSTSNPHAQTLDQHFDEIYRFYKFGSINYISTDGNVGVAGGSRTMEPKAYHWDALPFSEICRQQGIALPGSDAPIREYPETAAIQLRMPGTPGAAPAANSLAALLQR